MGRKLNIPTPTPANFNFKIFGARPVAYNPANIPESQLKPLPPFDPQFNPALEQLNLLSSANAAEQLIASYLGDFPKPTTDTMAPVGGTTLAGTSLLSNIEFETATYTDFSGQTKGFYTLTFNTVLIHVKQHKNIVETNIQGSDSGAILEYSGLNSYDVSFNIIVVADNENGIYPLSQGVNENGVEDIIKMLESPVSIKVNNWYLQMLNIYEIVVIDYEIGQTEGGISQQPITINARSNKTASLVVQNTSN